MINLKNEKNKSAVILNPERSEWVSRSHVTSVEPVVNDGAKTKRYSAKRDLYGPSLRSTLKMTVIAFIFTLATTTESSAETWDCGEIENTVSCSLDENGVFTISGTGKMKDYTSSYKRDNRPWDPYNIKTIVVDKGVTSIGKEAFDGAIYLESITIPDSVTSIGERVFGSAYGLTSITIPEGVTSIGDGAFGYTGLTSITIPDSVKSIGYQAFLDAKSLTSITIPDNIDTKNWNSMVFHGFPKDTKIVCQGDLNTCYEKLAKYFTNETCPQNLKDVCNCSSDCILPTRVIEATDPSQCTGNYGWSGAGCSRKNPDGSVPCVSGFVEWDKQCWSEYPFAKKRWTPAEANEWLHDGNDNFVVITFKK